MLLYTRVTDINMEIGERITDVIAQTYPELYRAIGKPVIRSVEIADHGNAGVVCIDYEAPLDFCHSYNPSSPVDNKNAPTVQGGLLGGILDNAMTMALQSVTAGRFVSTLEMSTKFLRPTRPGKIYAKAKVLLVTGRVAFVEASIFSDEAQTRMTAFATSTSKMRKPLAANL